MEGWVGLTVWGDIEICWYDLHVESNPGCKHNVFPTMLQLLKEIAQDNMSKLATVEKKPSTLEKNKEDQHIMPSIQSAIESAIQKCYLCVV